MNCPHCNTSNTEDALFCEECGGKLEAPAVASASVTATAGQVTASTAVQTSSPVADLTVRCVCGAGPDAIEDGFCTTCGVQRRRPPRDHFEVIVSAKVAGVSDVGKRHHQNEDYMVVTAHSGCQGLANSAGLIIVVCDGVSNSQNQQQGSLSGCETARDTMLALLKAGGTEAKEIVKAAIVAAQAAVCKVPFSTDVKDKEGEMVLPAQSTIVCALVIGKKVIIGWAGDSRAYWVTKTGITALSHDDSWLEETLAAGTMTEKEALKNENAHAITKSLGANNDGSNPGIEPSIAVMNIVEAGRLLLCSDGLWNYAEDQKELFRLFKALPADADSLTIARSLIDFANKCGGKDNITAAVASLS